MEVDQLPGCLELGLIQEHRLEGLAWTQFRRPEFKSQWRAQFIRNELIFKHLRDLEKVFEEKSIDVTVLKGFSLIGDIYPDKGDRFASDVDLLVSSKDLELINQLILEQNFSLQKDKKWKGNDFKRVYQSRDQSPEITLEFHTRLFWHCDVETHRCVAHPNYNHFKILSPEDQLLHLCGHLAFQHTFIKLFWLLDIQKFLKSYEDRMDWNLFWTRCEEFSLLESSQICLFLAGREEALRNPRSLRHRVLRKLCNSDFLIRPRSKPWKYFIIKALVKDRMQQSLIYAILWFIQFFRN